MLPGGISPEPQQGEKIRQALLKNVPISDDDFYEINSICPIKQIIKIFM